MKFSSDNLNSLRETSQPEEKGSYTYEYPRPAVTADAVIFGFDNHELHVLLIERGVAPFRGMWALPGGFMRMNETIDQCVRRELREETAMTDVYLEQMHVFSSTNRDPRGRVVTVAYIALVRPGDYQVVGGDDATRAQWFSLEWLPTLAFDHSDIISFARKYLREVLRLRPVAFRLLDEVFTVDELREVYEAINETHYDRRNFQRKLMQSKIVLEADDEPAFEAKSVMCCAEPEPPMPAIGSVPVAEEEEPPCMAETETPSRSQRRARKFVLSDKLRSLLGKNSASGDHYDPDDEGSIKDLFNF